MKKLIRECETVPPKLAPEESVSACEGSLLVRGIARLVYRMLRYGTKYVDRGAQFYEVQHCTQQIRHLKQKAAELGFQLVQAPAA